jgi:CheY-like chemotaxis protein
VDVLVSDIMMPGMRGTELARRFQLARPGVPVVMMSGYAPEPIPGELNAVTLLHKPFSAGQLVAAIVRALSSAPQGYDPDTSPLDASSREPGRARHAVPV